MRRPRLELVGIRLEPGPSISLDSGVPDSHPGPVLCDLSVFIQNRVIHASIFLSTGRQGGPGRAKHDFCPGGWTTGSR